MYKNKDMNVKTLSTHLLREQIELGKSNKQ
jgi:hypothetical protein